MTHGRFRWLLACVAMLPLAGPGRAQDAALAPAPNAMDLAIPDLSARLAALAPSDPASYFLLGEEVADVAVEETERALARRLYLIAFDLWRAAGDDRAAASACIALTTVVATDRDRRWLRAVARSLDSRHGAAPWETPSAIDVDPIIAYQAATALGAARSGDGVAARQLLSDPAVVLVLERFKGVLQPAGGLTRVQRDANVWPCPECRNKRVSRSRVPGDPSEMICASCRGDPGPRMRDEEIIAHLRLESLLLAGTHESWAAQVVSDDGAPLRDPTPDAVARTLGVDTRQSLFRDGAWVSPAPVPPTAESTPAPATEDGSS